MPVDDLQQPDSASNEPMMTIKKADGTFMRVPLSRMDFSSRPQASKTPPVKPALPRPTSPAVPAVVQDRALATTAPVREIFVDEAKYAKGRHQAEKKSPKMQEWRKEDAPALLEERLEVSGTHRGTSTELDQRVGRVIKQLSFSFSPELNDRVRALILSRLKDIRTDEQILEYANKDAAHGGLGLSSVDAQAFVESIRAVMIPARRVSQPAKDKRALDSMIDASIREEIDSLTALHKDAAAPVSRGTRNNRSPGPNAVADGKPVLHDIAVTDNVAKRTMGPIEELRQFSLIDFDRTAPTPEAVEMKLVERFHLLKNESFLLFLEARNAWQESPLYAAYQTSVAGALKAKQPLETYLETQKDGLSIEKVRALIRINAQVM